METNQENEIVKNDAAAPVSTEAKPAMPVAPSRGASKDFRQMPPRQKNMRRTSREPRAKSEYDQKIIDVRRVARVSKGGRRFSFAVSMILGNRKGAIGVGTGKGADTAIAIDKATRSAKKNMVHLNLTKSMSIAHMVEAKYSSARILIMPAPGRGVVAGSALRNIIELAGIKDVTTKIFSPSKNQLNTARAAVTALSTLRKTDK